MAQRDRHVLKLVKTVMAIATLAALPALAAETSLDSERLNLEMRMQQRVEEALGKILPPGQFVVVIKIEPVPQVSSDRGGERDSASDQYYLPGVPTRRLLTDNGENMKEIVDSLRPDSTLFKRFINRVTTVLVLDKDIPDDVVERVRGLTRQMLSLDDARGDTLDIQRTAFNKPSDQALATSGIQRIQRELKSYWILVALVLTVFCIGVFILFMFGPLRDFLNKFVQVLPTLKPNDSPGRGARQVYDVPSFPYMQPPFALPGVPAAAAASSASNFSGSLQVENPNKTATPFGFIREDHLSNLAILLSRESPEKGAVVLGYLPPEWISRVLSKMEPALQTEMATNLATTRQLLPEQVEDIEQDLKRRLDYLIGGPDRIFAVYESLEPEAQRRMLENLRESRPELAEELRNRTMLFEDLERLDAAALKTLLREVEIQTLVLALRGISPTFRDRMLEHVSQGKAQIVREELDLGEGSGGRATMEAQRKLVLTAKRLEREGQITIPPADGAVPTERYGAAMSGVPAFEPASPEGGAPEEGLDGMRERFRQMMDQTDSAATGTGD